MAGVSTRRLSKELSEIQQNGTPTGTSNPSAIAMTEIDPVLAAFRYHSLESRGFRDVVPFNRSARRNLVQGEFVFSRAIHLKFSPMATRMRSLP